VSIQHILRRFIPARWQRVGEKDALSLVMLLRRPYLFQREELQHAAEKAWRVSFDGRVSSTHCVAQSGQVTLLKAGPHLLNFFYYPGPYVEKPGENLAWLPRLSQQRAWGEHLACIGVDYMNPETDIELGYCVLAKLVAELLDENCTGIYLPRENSLIPNDINLYTELQRISSTRDSGVTTTG
jgi:hypothetical protein